MGLNLMERKAVSREIAKRYQKGTKKQKKQILDEFINLTKYSRCYASYILRNWGREIVIKGKEGNRIILIGDRKKRIKRNKPVIYDKKVFNTLKWIWKVCDCICGKRLAEYLKEIVPKLERHEELLIDEQTRQKLLKISAASIDRLLVGEKKKLRLKGRSRTKPGTLLKNQIPIKTFADWDEQIPGFVEIDLVSHDGGDAKGDYAQTLNVTDVYSGWTEIKALKNKAQLWTLSAIKNINDTVPFRILGIDSDNGSEFINAHLLRFCLERKITFTRTRPYRKNDNCYVEQKNYSVIRRAVGYYRYDTAEELEVLNQLYGTLRLYINFFQPRMKLMQKHRIGSKVKKKYDKPTTAYQRLLTCSYIPETTKIELKTQYEILNPVELQKEIIRLQNKLIDMVLLKNKKKKVYEKEDVFV